MMKQKIVSCLVSYFFKSTDNKYYACIVVNDLEFFVEVAYMNIYKELGKCIRVSFEAFGKARSVVKPGYKERAEETVKVLGIIRKPITKAGMKEVKAALGLA